MAVAHSVGAVVGTLFEAVKDPAIFPFVSFDRSTTAVCHRVHSLILGFPDASTLFPEPEPHVPASPSDPATLETDMGTVIAQLRPMRQVEVAGQVYPAVSRESQVVDVGTSGRQLIVTPRSS